MNLPAFRLERYFAEYEFAVPHLLSGSDCESMSVGELLTLEPGAQERFQSHWLGYTESKGAPSLREAIAGLYEEISPENILVFSGAEEAIFCFANAVLTTEDHVIVHYPCYQSLEDVARSNGCTVERWHAKAEADWAVHLDDLRKLLRPNTRAVIVNCPHNPSGYLMDKDQWAELHELSKEHGFMIFSDEVYRGLEYNSEDRLPSSCDLDDHSISLGVMSKAYGLAGLRIGWIATHNQGAYEQMAAYKDYTTICNSAPSEFLATLALRHATTVVERNLNLIKRNVEILDSVFRKHSRLITWKRPKAGPIAFPALTHEVNAATFCDELVRQAGVLLLPGNIYSDEFASHFRIGFGRADFPECIAILDRFLESR